jgi:signal peptidase I
MSHHNDDFREAAPRGPSDPDLFESLADDPVPSPVPVPLVLPTPEPPVAAEPLPAAPLALQTPVDVDAVRPEPSWRTLVGSVRAEHPWSTPATAVPSDLGAPEVVAEAGAATRLAPDVPAAEGTGLATATDTARELPHEARAAAMVEVASAADAIEQLYGERAQMPLASPEATEAPLRREPQPTVTLARIGEELFAWLKTLASAAVYATLIVTFGFQVARVEGQSMAPTLENQDRLIVNKLAYRLGQPQVGDIVMLYYPLNPDKSFVKRVIAEEGDQIRIVDGRVYRNDVPLNDDYVPPEYRSHDDYGPEVVPQGYYFVMGDHRNNSSDSRHWKFVPKKYSLGKVQLRWWPLPQARIF